MRKTSPTLLLALVLSLQTPAHAEDLAPRESLPTVDFETQESTRAYTRLTPSATAHYLFCGQGELRILSRALVADDAERTRYSLLATVDGERPAYEMNVRPGVVEDASFDGEYRAGALRRRTLELGRGCHTVSLTLARSNVEAVAVRLSWKEGSITKRSWNEPGTVLGGTPEELVVRGEGTPYRLLKEGDPLEVEIDGPAWVRLLARPVGQAEPMSYALEVERGGKPYRSYLLENKPSRRARLAGQPGLRLGTADEVVFPVPAGRQRITLRGSQGLDLLLRPLVSEGRGAPESTGEWLTRARLSSYYDDNILRYSDRFIQRFESGQDPDRFRVESLDDYVQRLDFYVDRRFPGIGGRRAEIGLDLEHRAYLRNSIKDWSRFALSWEQDLGFEREIRFTTSYIPNFYVRHLRDSDLRGLPNRDRFQAFEFERTEARVDYFHDLAWKVRARYHLGLAVFRHSDAYTEFDSENVFAGVRLDQEVGRGLRFSYALEYTDSAAQGYDEPGETLETSDDTDPSYRQFDIMLAVRYRLPGKRDSTFFLQGELGQREYTTNRPPDLVPLHAGREDDILRFYASWQVELSKRYSLTLFAQTRDRSSTALIDFDIGLERNFEQYELGARLSARLGK